MERTTKEQQQYFLENLLSEPDLFNKCYNILKAEYFVPELRKPVEFLLDYHDKYSTIPSIRTIQAETGYGLQECKLRPDEIEHTATKIEGFCRQEAVISAVLLAGEWIKKGDYGSFIERIEKAVGVSLNSDVGMDIFKDIAERIEERAKQRPKESTGWKNVDELLDGGWTRTELMLISANSGGGKSVALTNLAINMAKRGHHALYISLELQEDLVSDRIETMISRIGKAEKYDRRCDVETNMLQFQSESGGSIIVKYMPAGETSSRDIKVVIDEYHTLYGRYPDLLVVDYLDILETNSRRHYSNVFDKDKQASTELRTLGNSPVHPMWMATASQQRREAIGEVEVNQSHIAGGISKVNICDIYISIVLTDAMRNEGIAEFSFQKTRSSGGVGKSASMLWDPVYLWFTDAEGYSSAPINTPSAGGQQSSNGKTVGDSLGSTEEDELLSFYK